ncbi:ABC transporter ATP-binding protein [Silicimonas algicola]|uniref:ATP-binding cassette subfamily B protein n=1 Tax=Silicimonas algicola TaxID=1826607 RepID=A0A316GDG7_9RHOB|nr:ABC transporter ATP-binding protein [Silicimonas algicola]PWK59049.1 ATP-binding cassette subfamily B protein [Silicimonas algicola]
MTFTRLIGLARPYWLPLSVVSGLLVLRTSVALGIPWLGGKFAAGVFSDRAIDLDLVLLAVVVLFGVRSALAYVTDRRMATLSARIVTDLRQRIFTHIQNLPLGYFRQRRQGDILSFAVYEPEHLSAFATGTLTSLLPNILAVAGALAVMASIAPLLAAIVLLLVPLFYVGLRLIGRRLRPLSVEARDAYSDLVSTVDENLSMMPAVKAFTREVDEAESYRLRAERLRSLEVEREGLTALLNAAIQFGAVLAMVILLRLLGDRVTGGAMSVSDFVTFLLYAAFLTGPFSSLAGVWAATQHARGAMTRLDDLFGEAGEGPAIAAPAIGPIRGDIVFEDVHLAYPGRASALNGVDLRIPAGQTVALVGANGAGKTTLVNLLTRFDRPDRGVVRIDGTDVSTVDLRSLREQIAVLSQTVLLFNASIRENIAFGLRGAGDAAIEDAARRAQAHAFVSRLPDGYDTIVGDRGIRLSGGQAQRVALARALLKDPAILVLDEPTAMFDPEGEDAFIADARAAFADRTVILITHRPGSLALADRVVTLSEGKVVADEGKTIALSTRREVRA